MCEAASVRHRVAMLLLVLVTTTAGCADANKTLARGREELARHTDDPLLDAVPPGLQLVQSEQHGAEVDSGLFHVVFPTTFARTFATTGLDPTAVLDAFDGALGAHGATAVAGQCSISVPAQLRTWAAQSAGDHLTLTVTVTPRDSVAPVREELVVKRSSDTRVRGLADCLTRKLPASAYTAAWAGRPRTHEELCGLLGPSVRRAAFDGATKLKGTACSVTGRRGSHRSWVQVADVRERSLAQLLDNVSPGTDPAAPRFEDLGDLTKWIVLPHLRSGALVVSSDRIDVLRAAADAIETADRRVP